MWFDDFHAAIARQPAHGAFHRVVLKVADQHLVARLQTVVVADQRLQGFGGIAGEGDGGGVGIDQPGQLAEDRLVFTALELLAYMQRVAAVDKRHVFQVLRLYRLAHAAEVTVLQVDRAGLQHIALGDGVPVVFVVCIPWHGMTL